MPVTQDASLLVMYDFAVLDLLGLLLLFALLALDSAPYPLGALHEEELTTEDELLSAEVLEVQAEEE